MSMVDGYLVAGRQAERMELPRRLASEWDRALAGDPDPRGQWQVVEGGRWDWQAGGVSARNSGTEWSGLSWQQCRGPVLRELKRFVIEVTVSGKAGAAGISFGPYKDFLTPLDDGAGPRRLQLEVDAVAGCWAFRVDGQLAQRCWWDAAIHGADDLVGGALTLKGREVEQVLFRDLAIATFQSACRLSVVVTCHRFLQRLRVSLRNWCHQSLPIGAYEVLVVNPNSPDGTHEHLLAVTGSYPHVRVREVAVGSRLATNKAAMINRALAASRGEWVWLADADCLFSPTCALAALSQIHGRDQRLFYGQRRYLSAAQTDALLSGRADGLRDFDALAQAPGPRAPDTEPWGYTQIVHRSTLERVRYREEVRHFRDCDTLFVEDCRRHHVTAEQVDGLFCLHMEHPYAHYGTKLFL